MIITNTNVRKICLLAIVLSSTLAPLFAPPLNINTTNGLEYALSGNTITKYWGRGDIKNQLTWPNGNWGRYWIWSKSWKIPNKYGTITFSAMASNDIHVGITNTDPWLVQNSDSSFYSNLVSSSNFYEIVIGGWANNHSALRKGAGTEPIVFVSEGIPSNSRLIHYQITLYQNRNNEDCIAVYVRDAQIPTGAKWERIIMYKDPSMIDAEERWFTFSTWDSGILYTNIIGTASTKLPVME